MAENRRGSHTVYNIQYHLVWVSGVPFSYVDASLS